MSFFFLLLAAFSDSGLSFWPPVLGLDFCETARFFCTTGCVGPDQPARCTSDSQNWPCASATNRASTQGSLAFNLRLGSEFFLLLSFLDVALDYFVNLDSSDCW